MADANKITAEELESVQGLVTASREAEANYFKISLEVERLTGMRSSAFTTSITFSSIVVLPRIQFQNLLSIISIF